MEMEIVDETMVETAKVLQWLDPQSKQTIIRNPPSEKIALCFCSIYYHGLLCVLLR